MSYVEEKSDFKSIENFLDLLKNEADSEKLRTFVPILRRLEDKYEYVVSSDDHNLLGILNDCYPILFSYTFSKNQDLSEEAQGDFLDMSFILLLIKLKQIDQKDIEFSDAVVNVLNLGSKCIRILNKYGSKSKAIQYNAKCIQLLEKVNLEHIEVKSNLYKYFENRKTLFTLLFIESKLEDRKFNEGAECLFQIKQEICKSPHYLEYFLYLLHNTSINYLKLKEHDKALQLLVSSRDIITNTSSEEIKHSLFLLLAVAYYHTKPETNWQDCIDALDEIGDPDMVCLAWKFKAALISNDINPLKKVLKEIDNIGDISVEFVLYLAETLKNKNYENLASETLKQLRNGRFKLIQSKLQLMTKELQIYFESNFLMKAGDLLNEVLELVAKRKTPIEDINPLLRIVFVCMSGETPVDERLSVYSRCLLLMKELNVKNYIYHNIQQRICLCLLELNDAMKAKNIVFELTESVHKNSYDVFLIFKTAFLSEDETLIELLLKFSNIITEENIAQALFNCVRNFNFVHCQEKKEFLLRFLDVLIQKSTDSLNNLFSTKLYQLLVRLYLDNAENCHDRIIFLLDKAVNTLTQENGENVNWFSSVSWNLALKPENEDIVTYRYFVKCCQFLRLANDSNNRLKQTLMLVIAAGLAVIRKAEYGEDFTKEVIRTIEECKNLDKSSIPAFQRLLFLYDFEAKLYLNDCSSLTILLQNPDVDANTLQSAAALAYERNKNNYKIISMALQAALDQEIGKCPQDTRAISQIVHNLLQILFFTQAYVDSSIGRQIFDVCEKLLKLLEGSLHDYSETEILWIMSKCWNCSIENLMAGSPPLAREWASLAMKFLSKLSALKSLHEMKLTKFYTLYFS